MIRRFGRIAIAAMLLAGPALAGCGGGGSTSTAAKTTAAVPTITKAELVAKANAICTTGNGPLLALASKLASHPSHAQVAAIVEQTYVPAVESQITSIRALGVPAGEQAIVARMLALAESDLARLKRDPALVNTDVFGGFAKVAHPYGLVACAPTS